MDDEASETTSPLQILSGGAPEPALGAILERRRRPRICLTREQFRLGTNGKVYPVQDLSPTGMGLRVIESEDLIYFSAGAEISGHINLEREKLPVSAKVTSVRSGQVGCEFRNVSVEVQSALAEFLDPARMGRELRAVPAPDHRAIWYHGPSGTDFLVWRGWDGQLTRLSVFVLGSFIQWDGESGVATGKILACDEANLNTNIIHFETMILERDEKPDVGKMSLARIVLQNAHLPEDFRTQCLRKIT